MPDLEHGHDEPSRPLGSIQIGGYARGPSLVAVTVRGGVLDLRRE